MSIIHDALKKAQEQRKKAVAGIPYSPPEIRKKPGIIIIAAVLVLAGAVVAYLYIPAFHKQKMPAVSQTKAAQPVSKVVAQAKTAAEPSLPREAVPQKAGEKTEPAKTGVSSEQKQAGTIKGEQDLIAGKAVPQKAGAVKIPVSLKTAASPAKQMRADEAGQQEAKARKGSRATVATRQVEEQADEGPVQRFPARRTDEERLDASYNEALNAMNSGQSREAQKIFLSILSRKPGHVESLNNLGVIEASQGNKQEALNYFKKILEYRTDYPKAYNNIGLVMMSGGDTKLAEEYFRKAISLEPDSLEPSMNLCALLRTQGKYREAAKVLEAPIKKNVRDPLLFLSYAVVKDNLGQSEEAIRYYRQYLSLARQSDVKNGVLERLRYLEGKK